MNQSKLIRDTARTFEKRAKNWESDHGELGKIVANEIRAVNDGWKAVKGPKRKK